MNRPGPRPTVARPPAIELAAAILVAGGVVGLGLLVRGDYAVTGSLPARGPIVGVAAILYATSIVLGLALRRRLAWLGAINLTALFALAYLAAFGHPLALVLGTAHALAGILLWRSRGWFAGPMGDEGPGRPALPPDARR
jgi:hypothetical protein